MIFNSGMNFENLSLPKFVCLFVLGVFFVFVFFKGLEMEFQNNLQKEGGLRERYHDSV